MKYPHKTGKTKSNRRLKLEKRKLVKKSKRWIIAFEKITGIKI